MSYLCIANDINQQLKHSIKNAQKSIEVLQAYATGLAEDMTTFDLLKGYYKDEEEDMYWSQEQLDLIKLIGRENWLIKQI